MAVIGSLGNLPQCVHSQWSLAFVYRIPEDGEVYTWAPHPRKRAEGEKLETGGHSKCPVFSVVRCLNALVGMLDI